MLSSRGLEIGMTEAETAAAARSAGLRYVSDDQPGIRRQRRGRGFVYVGPDGARISEPDELARIRSIAVPPAWTDVWICPVANGHLQAVGRDARRRKQYRYHERWREVRDAAKFDHLADFARALPRIRRRIAADLARPGLPREKVVATVVRLLDTTALRIGNEEYARDNDSFGLTTLRDEHVGVEGETVRFQFRGKGGKEVSVDVRDRRVARVVGRCEELPGQDLFQYLDASGERHVVRSTDVNDWLRDATGADITAKDFRTWAGTVLAAAALSRAEPPTSDRETRRAVVDAVRGVARELGNTPAVCRRCYIHPDVLEAPAGGGRLPRAEAPAGRRRDDREAALTPEEASVLALLRTRARARDRRSPAV